MGEVVVYDVGKRVPLVSVDVEVAKIVRNDTGTGREIKESTGNQGSENGKSHNGQKVSAHRLGLLRNESFTHCQSS